MTNALKIGPSGFAFKREIFSPIHPFNKSRVKARSRKGKRNKLQRHDGTTIAFSMPL